MADQQDFETLLSTLNGIDRKSIRKLDMPVDQAIKEGEVMAAAATEDSVKLAAVGFDVARINALGAAVGALRFAQAQYTSTLGEHKEATRQWAAEEPAAIELRAEMLAAEAFALRKIPDAVKALKHIREGSGNPDMIQDIAGLAQVGKKYPDSLKSINFDLSILDTAAEKAGILSKLYAKAFIENSTTQAKDLRDRAFSYMRSIMSDVLEVAEYVFRKDKARLGFYHSEYRARQKSSTMEAIVIPEKAPATAK